VEVCFLYFLFLVILLFPLNSSPYSYSSYYNDRLTARSSWRGTQTECRRALQNPRELPEIWHFRGLCTRFTMTCRRYPVYSKNTSIIIIFIVIIIIYHYRITFIVVVLVVDEDYAYDDEMMPMKCR
jgi:hypothetical protein